jgi:hypothetical protein
MKKPVGNPRTYLTSKHAGECDAIWRRDVGSGLTVGSGLALAQRDLRRDERRCRSSHRENYRAEDLGQIHDGCSAKSCGLWAVFNGDEEMDIGENECKTEEICKHLYISQICHLRTEGQSEQTLTKLNSHTLTASLLSAVTRSSYAPHQHVQYTLFQNGSSWTNRDKGVLMFARSSSFLHGAQHSSRASYQYNADKGTTYTHSSDLSRNIHFPSHAAHYQTTDEGTHVRLMFRSFA